MTTIILTVITIAITTQFEDKPITVPEVKPSEKIVNVTFGVIIADVNATARYTYTVDAAIQAINDYCAVNKIPIKFNYRAKTSNDSMNALSWIQEMKQEGVKVFITGPNNSPICASDSYINHNGLTMIGTPSVGFCPSHNRVDNIFRVSPNQRENTLAVSKLLEKDGVKALIVVQQDDGTSERIDGFVDEIIGATAGLKEHRVVEVGFNEAPPESYMEEAWRMSEELMNRVSDTLGELEQRYPMEEIGILYASFTPDLRHIVAADRHPELVNITWYSTTYFTQHGLDWGPIVGNHTSSLHVLAPEVYLNLENPIYLELEENFEETPAYVSDKVKLGLYEASMYDAAWLGALAVIEANSTSAESVRSAFIQVAGNYTGATGRMILDQNGDRFMVDHLIYDYQLVNGALESHPLYRFDAVTGVIIDNKYP